MNALAKPPTKADAIRAAKRKFPGKQIAAKHNPVALTKEKKREQRDRIIVIDARLEQLRPQRIAADKLLLELADAAQFVCDVDGQPAALASLKDATARVKQQIEWTDEVAELRAERERVARSTWAFRCELAYLTNIAGIGTMAHVISRGDTWAECIERMEASN